MEKEGMNWSESVEDLVDGGETGKAISLLESVVSMLETLNFSDESQLQLSSALSDLAKLYSSNGFSLKADDAQSRALLIKHRSTHFHNDSGTKEVEDGGDDDSRDKASSCNNGDYEEDWEAAADRAPDELLSPQCLPGLSKIPLEGTEVQTHFKKFSLE